VAFGDAGNKVHSTGSSRKRERNSAAAVIARWRVHCDTPGMTTMPLRSIMCAGLLLALALVSPAAGESLVIVPPATQAQVRTTDRRLGRLLTEGVHTSATLRSLVDRLNDSDVVVYVRCDPMPPVGVAGRLTFLASGGGLRYVIVRVSYLASRAQQLAILGHELQHAVEIAQTPEIVDAESLAREYAGTVGYATFSLPGASETYDSHAAIEVGSRVLREMTER
jgi:hypothetical protein